MSTFHNGPAAGVTLQLSRAPIFLRVVRSSAGVWDALNQPDDTPAADEEIFVYQLDAKPLTAHVDGLDEHGRRFGRWLAIASYHLYATQPPDSILRDNTQWTAWCHQQDIPPHL